MTTLTTTVKDGRIELPAPPEWPDGTEVTIRPLAAEDTFGIREEDWPESPEAIAAWLTWYDSLEPLLLSDEERTAWETARQQQKEFEKAAFADRAEKLRRMWE